MCGIVGYVGKKSAPEFLLGALEKLEYRGYDSSGIAICNDKEKKDKVELIKKKGRIRVLRETVENFKDFFGKVGIGHTRWATHGEPSDINSHPHTGASGKIAVVHNGIIENYMILKKNLMQKGIKFASETDTEVVAVLADYLYDGDIFETVRKTALSLEGSFALGILCSDFPDRIIAVKKESPLILGFGNEENYIASDISAFADRTKKICRLDECEMAVIKNSEVSFYNFSGEKINKTITEIDWNIGSSEKNGFDHFMLKEIMEQPKAVKETLSARCSNNDILIDDLTKEYLENINKIYIVACGSSHHVGVAAKYAFEKLSKITTNTDLASEFRYRSPIIDEKTLVIIISQSGETADSLAALREAKHKGAKTLAVVNVVGSSIAAESDCVIYTWAGMEVAVATTKAYSAQLSVMYMLALHIAKILNKISKEKFEKHFNNLLNLPDLIEKTLEEKTKVFEIAKKYCQRDNVFFIGRNNDYAICMEGSLKFKEVSYIHSEAYPAGELKHGTISLIESGTLVIAVATNHKLFEKTISNVREVKARGAVCLALTTEDKREEIACVADDTICVPRIPPIMQPSLSVIPLQLFSYYVALLRERDIDRPRNLAKSVTVE
ncbi:MAG: glutamine--fructose-6-phosphate transaminase (isomerizing) [Oscillospiraceae bacterium]|jgi:glucosamine--fructose-6-phosphate aminotransferase (isomerizing)|nr:glutamine--fructose-6-phosphate transaminase (isomerizing) [Oscillospiraceae bacterium]